MNKGGLLGVVLVIWFFFYISTLNSDTEFRDFENTVVNKLGDLGGWNLSVHSLISKEVPGSWLKVDKCLL